MNLFRRQLSYIAFNTILSDMKSFFNTYIVLLITSMLMFSCTPESPMPSPTPPSEGVVKHLNVSYGPDVRNKMDIRLADGRSSSTPFVVIIHGGAWTAGDKADLAMIADSLINHGISSACINYRYASNTIHFEELMADVGLALDKISEMSGDWNIRESDYGMFGHSAGAHMALLYAYKFDSNNLVKAVVAASGPTDINDIDFLNYSALIGLLPQIQYMVGATYTIPVPVRFEQCSPADNPGSNPTLLLHGSSDLVVAEEHSNRMKNILDVHGTVNDIFIVSGAGHDLGIGDEATKNLILGKIIDWLETHD